MPANGAVSNLFAEAGAALASADVEEKCRLTAALSMRSLACELSIESAVTPEPSHAAGRPERPTLVHPSRVPRRNLGTDEGRAALVHALAHIEFNAINLALDATYRFRGMPEDYYGDWLSVAAEEAAHFSLLRGRLTDLGYQYGDLPAHNGLWDMAERTAHDVLARMALVPRVLEARGLDVAPRLIDKLQSAGDADTAGILDIILRDEIRHVAIGSRWFRYVCGQRGVEPEDTFRALVDEYIGGPLRGPFHTEARLAAGFSEAELDALNPHIAT